MKLNRVLALAAASFVALAALGGVGRHSGAGNAFVSVPGFVREILPGTPSLVDRGNLASGSWDVSGNAATWGRGWCGHP